MSFKMSLPPRLPAVPPLDSDVQQAAVERQSRLIKPVGALGRLEVLSVRLAAMTGDASWLPRQPAVIVCAGDHGVAEQGVSAYPRSHTKQTVLNIVNGGAAVSVLAKQMHATVTVVDAGIAGILPAHENLINGKVNFGTTDFTMGMAMSPRQAAQAVQVGLDAVNAQIDTGADIIVLGDAGVGNTTVSAALIVALTGAAPERVTGQGMGLTTGQLERKLQAVETALELHSPVDEDTLAKLGGYEIAAMVGVMIGAAARRVPVVLDGYPTAAAALVAARMEILVVNYLIAGHRSAALGHGVALQTLGLTPMLEISMRLGEGTGGVLALPLIEASMRTLQEMATTTPG
jgi:nicotinate-nucleotide--dimethylbenzimidazole phosphoribosyltransferase